MSRSRDFGAAASSLAAPSSSNNGYSYVVDTTQSSGWNFAGNQAAGKNFLINGAMDVFQRNTWAGSSNWALDRWFVTNYGSNQNGMTVTQGNTNPPTGFKSYMKILTASTTYTNCTIAQSLETIDVLRLAGKTVTLSFYYRVPAAWSLNWGYNIFYSTNIDQNLNPSVSGNVLVGSSSGGMLSTSVNNNWVYVTKTFTVPLNATSLAVEFEQYNNIIIGSEMNITGVQLEIGSVATPFSRAGGLIGSEIYLCQKFYYQTPTYVTASYSAYNSGNMITTPFFFPTKMRIAPTVTVADSASVANKITIYPGGGSAASGITPAGTTTITPDYWYYLQGGTSSGSQGTSGIISLYYYASAEL
jgi:hypothetical protein